MTFQRKLLLGVSLMVLPALLIGAEAIRSNALEQRALETLGTRLGRSRTYAELETAMFNQTEVIWRYLTGLDPRARKEHQLAGEVVQYWFDRWKAELGPDEASLADQVWAIQLQFMAVSNRVFALADRGDRALAYQTAQAEVRSRLQPALTALNRQVYRRTRESSVSGAFARVAEIVQTEQRALIAIFLVSVAAGLVAAALLARSLARPINELRAAMSVVARGDLDHPVTARSSDEIGELAQSFSGMTASLRQSRSEMVRLNDELQAKVAQLERAQAQLVQSEKLASIGEMSAAVAHGLRNPLASLRASAQLVLHHPGSPAAPEQLRAIIEEVDRLDRRISHLLAFSRPAPFHPLPERLAAMVQQVLPAFADRGRTQGVAIVVDLPDALPDVPADAMKLEQTLVELISNAFDAMPDGGRLTLSAVDQREPDGRAGVLLTIADTGRGIAGEALPNVGQPFFTTRPDGTGLGVATARRFIEQHGGTLTLESVHQRGTTVRVWLPLQPRGAIA
jgi:signal transduction histidine kinase